MSLEAMQAVVARLLTDKAFQGRFFADAPARARDYGLSTEEFRLLASLDARKLGITCEGYAGKRLERVESAFPRTVRALDAAEPGGRFRYLERTAFPPGEAAERAAFVDYLRAPRWPAEAQRFLQDLADLELALYEAPVPSGLPAYRYRPEATRPRRTPFALEERTRGPLDTALAGPGLPPAYPHAAGRFLALREGERVRLESLAGPAGALFEACDGTRTVAELEAAHGPGTQERLQAWLRAQVVEDAGPDAGRPSAGPSP